MRHFYRTHLVPADVLAAADAFFPTIGMAQTATASRARTFSGPLGTIPGFDPKKEGVEDSILLLTEEKLSAI